MMLYVMNNTQVSSVRNYTYLLIYLTVSYPAAWVQSKFGVIINDTYVRLSWHRDHRNRLSTHASYDYNDSIELRGYFYILTIAIARLQYRKKSKDGEVQEERIAGHCSKNQGGSRSISPVWGYLQYTTVMYILQSWVVIFYFWNNVCRFFGITSILCVGRL